MTQLQSENESQAAALPLATDALEAGVRIGEFRIERRLGAGGMGIVYLARQTSLNRLVALKVLGQALSRGTDVTRFQREAQAAARLKHPAIAQVYYIGQDRHVCYLAMELIDGISLRRVLDRLGTTTAPESSLDTAVQDELTAHPVAQVVRFDLPTEDSTRPGNETPRPGTGVNPYLSPQARELRTGQAHVRRVCEVVRDAALALAHAHEQGVVHRDIKPDNLLLDRHGKLHVIDFGVARFFEDQSVTCTGQLVGTPLYMSPEQVTGRGVVDCRSDVYSLGLVLYELLALRPPIEAGNREHLLRTIVTKPLPPISWRNSAVQGDLERVVHKATQKDPDQRYASAAEFAADLDRCLVGKPALAPPYRFRLDEREITAARPSQVVLAAVIFFIVAFFVFTAMASVSMMMGFMLYSSAPGMGLWMFAIQSLIAVTILATGLTIGRGLLSGRALARWAGVAIAALLSIAALSGAVGMAVGVVTVAGSNDADWQISSGTPPAKPPTQTVKSSTQTPAPTVTFSPRMMVYGMMAMYSLPIVMALGLGVTAMWCLLCRVTGQWFAFASQIRHEHKVARQQMAG